MHEDYVAEVSRSLIDGKVAFLAGAGISMNRNTWLPGWNDLIKDLLKIVAGQDKEFEINYIQDNYMKLLFNEVFLNQMDKALGTSHVMDALRICMDIDRYNCVHKFLAWSMSKSVVLTTNYDELIERAGKQETKPIKLHGSLNAPETMRFTVSHIFKPIDDPKIIAPKLNERTLVVIGYKGADEFDVIPFLFETAKLKKFIWITHQNPNDDLDPNTMKRLEERGDPYFKANIDEFLKAVYEKSKLSMGSDKELDEWNDGNKIGGDEYKNHWQTELSAWGNHLREVKRSQMDYLWAQMLNYLRIYLLDRGGKIFRPAEEAYIDFLKTNRDPILELNANLQLAYIKRITREDESFESKELVNKLLKNTIDEINNRFNNETDATTKNELQKLLARGYHELGVAMQNQDLHSQANDCFRKSIQLRRNIGDPELAYSVFQQFFNCHQAYITKKIDIDKFIPNWKRTLLIELKQDARFFKEASDPENHATTCHNLAYIHQSLADEYERAKKLKEAEEEYLKAKNMYREAKAIRERLRDPRRIAQSNVRIAECNLGLARFALQTGEPVQKVCGLVEAARALAIEAENHYKKIPQERIRTDDIMAIFRMVEHLNHKAHCK